MWNIILPEETKWIFEKDENLDAEQRRKKSSLFGKNTEQYIKTHTYEEYIKLPTLDNLLKERRELEPIVYACYQCQKYNFGKRQGQTRNGSKDEQLIGILTQTILADYLQQPRPEGNQGFDNGKDFMLNGVSIDVKCMGRGCYMEHQWVHNLIAAQLENNLSDTDYYLFCSFNKKKAVIQICGYVQKKLIPKCAKRLEKGTERYRDDGTPFTLKADIYELNQDVLYYINKKEDLFRMNKKHLETTINDDFVASNVKWYELMEEALDGNPIAIEELNKLETERFELVQQNSTVSDLTTDIYFMNNEERSLDDILCSAKRKSTYSLENIMGSYSNVYTISYHNERNKKAEEKKKEMKNNSSRYYFDR